MIKTITLTEVWTTDAWGQADDYRCFREWNSNTDACIKELESTGREVHVTQHQAGTCPCGESIDLIDDTNECENCGLLFNAFGQELRPLDEWEDY